MYGESSLVLSKTIKKIIEVLGRNIFSNERKTRKKRGDDPTSARPTKKKVYFNKADEKIEL